MEKDILTHTEALMTQTMTQIQPQHPKDPCLQFRLHLKMLLSLQVVRKTWDKKA